MVSFLEMVEAEYTRHPHEFEDKVDGVCDMPWNQALEDKPVELANAVSALQETVLDTMGSFTWFWGRDWFVETELGNFHWKDPDYEGDNSFTLFDGTYEKFCKHLNIDHGRAKGFKLIRNGCGTDIVLALPKEIS